MARMSPDSRSPSAIRSCRDSKRYKNAWASTGDSPVVLLEIDSGNLLLLDRLLQARLDSHRSQT
jgi:hypothetical protein